MLSLSVGPVDVSTPVVYGFLMASGAQLLIGRQVVQDHVLALLRQGSPFLTGQILRLVDQAKVTDVCGACAACRAQHHQGNREPF